VLALLPTSKALDCARQLHDQLESIDVPGGAIQSSAGIAVAHYKFDLRDALEAARSAEQESKQQGKKCFVLRVLRRSGEHSSGVLPWDRAGHLQQFIQWFRAGRTDRWTYQLRGEMSALLGDLLKKSDSGNGEHPPPAMTPQILSAPCSIPS